MNEASPLARYVVPLRRWWYVVAACLVVGLVFGVATMPQLDRQPTAEELADPNVTFRATHLLIRNTASPEPINFDLVELLARQGDLINRVVDRMDGEVTAGEVEAVSLETDASLGTISVTAVRPDPEGAATLATTYAEVLSDVVDDRASQALREELDRIETRLPQLADDVEQLEQRVAELDPEDLERRLLESELEQLVGQFGQEQNQARALRSRIDGLESQFETLQEPSPVSTASDNLLSIPVAPVPRLLIIGLLSLLAGVGIVLLVDALDTRVRTRRDAELAYGLPVIAEIPPRSKAERDREPLPVLTEPVGLTAEAFRTLRVALRHAPRWRLGSGGGTTDGSVGTATPEERRGDPRTLLVTSALTGDGKSTTAANLAAVFASAGQSVLVVDCDFRRPAVGQLLGVRPGHGLRDVEATTIQGLEAMAVPTRIPGVALIRSGEPGIAPAWFLNDADSFVARVRELAEVIIFDTGPITLTNEASELVRTMDAVLLVNRVGRLTRSAARDTIEQLTRLRASMAGVVLVGTHGAKRYGYYSPLDPSSRPSTSRVEPDDATGTFDARGDRGVPHGGTS